MGSPTYSLVFGSVSVGHLFAIGEIGLESWVDDQFFANRMASKFPGELVLPAGSFVVSGAAQDLAIHLLELPVVMLDSFGETRHGWDGGREEACAWSGTVEWSLEASEDNSGSGKGHEVVGKREGTMLSSGRRMTAYLCWRRGAVIRSVLHVANLRGSEPSSECDNVAGELRTGGHDWTCFA